MKGNDKIILGLSLLAMGLLIYGIFPHIGLTYDSKLYIDLADKLLSEGFSQRGFGSKPPLFPIILSVLQANLTVVSIGNILCWGLSMYLLIRTFMSQIEGRFYKYCFAAVLLFSTPVIMVHNFIWTEPFYLLFISAFFYILAVENISNKNLLLAILLLLIISLKHIGVSVVFVFVAIALVANPKGWKKTILIYTPAVLFFIGWQLHSYYIRGDLSRLAHMDQLDFLRNIESVGQVLAHWIFPFPVPLLVSIGAFLLVIYFSMLGVIRSSGLSKYAHGFTVILLLVLLTKGDLIPNDTERYLAISFPFLAFFFYKFLSNVRFLNQYFVKSIALLIIAYTIIRTLKNCLLWHHIY